jgi:hypothetical protein
VFLQGLGSTHPFQRDVGVEIKECLSIWSCCCAARILYSTMSPCAAPQNTCIVTCAIDGFRAGHLNLTSGLEWRLGVRWTDLSLDSTTGACGGLFVDGSAQHILGIIDIAGETFYGASGLWSEGGW